MKIIVKKPNEKAKVISTDITYLMSVLMNLCRYKNYCKVKLVHNIQRGSVSYPFIFLLIS